MARPAQMSLLPEPKDLARAALRKIEKANPLTPGELEALKLAVSGKLEPKARTVANWHQIVACWRNAYERRTGFACPRLSDKEAIALKAVASKCLTTDVTCAVIEEFWNWRNSSEWAQAVDPTTFGLLRHLARVQEYVGEKSRRKAEQAARDARLRPTVRDPVKVDQVHELVADLESGVDLVAKHGKEQEQHQQRLAESCLEMAARL